MNTFKHMWLRRPQLRVARDSVRDAETLLESCIPSYCHTNWLASYAAWSRLTTAAALSRRFASDGPVLDFGSGSGEVIGPLGDQAEDYAFVEESDSLADLVKQRRPSAKRYDLNNLPKEYFAVVLCLDSLEHNPDYGAIAEILWDAVRRDGILVLSGPTENSLYRLGRRVAGFSGHYHETNIFAIERVMGMRGVMADRKLVPFGLPLFAISVWKPRP